MPSNRETLPIVTFCAYLTEVSGLKWRPEDYTASQMDKALKGIDFKGYFEINLDGKTRRFNNENAKEFAQLVPGVLLKAIRDRVSGPACLVPIPNSHVTSPDDADFKTLALADSISRMSKGQFSVSPMLVFSKPQQKSREGGSRSPFHFESEYRIVGKPSGNIVLIDDVTTTGGHLIGAAWKLNSASSQVSLGCAFGSSTKEQQEKPLEYRDQELSLSRGLIDFDF